MVTPPDTGRPRFLIVWGLSASLLVAGLYFYPPFFLADLSQRAYDVLLRSARRPETSGRVVIVTIDEKSLARFGRWPWPRSRLGQLVEKIRALGAVSIGIVMIFAERDESRLSAAERAFMESRNKPRPDVEHLTVNDAALAAALARTSILGYEMQFGSDREERQECILHPIPIALLQEPGAQEKLELFKSSGALCSLPGLAQGASGSGFLNVTIDADGILRRIPLIMARGELVYPSLGLATLIPALGVRQFALHGSRSGTASLVLGDISVPLDPRGEMLLPFRGGKHTFPYISAADVLDAGVAAEEFRDRIVFLGTSAVGLGDSVATPLDTTFPGVEVYATVADTILRRDFIQRLPWAPSVELALVIAAGPVVAFSVAVVGIAWAGLLLVFATVGLWSLNGWLMGSAGLFVDPLFPSIAFAASFVAATLASLLIERSRADHVNRHLTQTREAMLEELRKSGAELQAAQQRAKLGTWELDLATQTGSWSAEMFRLFDCNPAGGVPTLAQFLAMVHPDDRRALEKGLARIIETGEPLTQEFRNNPLNGAAKHFNAVVYATKSAAGQVVHLSATMQDITALVEAKRALDIYEQEAVLGRVAASVAHEINNPLMAIKTRLHTLKKTIADRPDTAEKLDLVMGQVDRIGRATRSMLGFFKQRAPSSTPIPCTEVIRAVLDLFDPSFEAKGVRVRVDIPHSLPCVSINVDELQEVLINLLENERDALGRDNDLSLCAQSRDHQIVITIEDNGPGLGDDPERLFEAFHTTKSTGTGLGLTIARRICESYGGTLTAANRKGGGACFEIVLPVANMHDER